MKKTILLSIASVLILTIGLSGCGTTAIPETSPTKTATPTAVQPTTTLTLLTLTPDLCASENIRPVVDKVHRHMREFDDAARLAASIQYDQLREPIAELQRIRREAEDEQVPTCLASLKKYQIDHMNAVIEVLIAFMNASNPAGAECVTIDSAEEELICQLTGLARQQHDQYTLELARILGIPIVTATPGAIIPLETPTP
jgi:hypothetical protein